MARIPLDDDRQVANPRLGQPRQDLILEIFRDRPVESAGAGSDLEGDHVDGAIHPDTWQSGNKPWWLGGSAMPQDTGCTLSRQEIHRVIVRNPE